MNRRRHVTKALCRAAAFSAMLLLAGLCSPALAQVTSQCAPTMFADGAELRLHLNSHWDATTNRCEPNVAGQPSDSGEFGGCYDGEQFNPEGQRLSSLTTCAPCRIGTDPGCYFVLPPPNRFNIDLLPPFNPFPDFDPFPKTDPGDIPIFNPGEILPDEPPPVMTFSFYRPWRWR